MKIADTINKSFNYLNSNERDVIYLITENKQQFNNLTIDGIAKKCLVSKSFIMRLCKKLGYSGYSEFKYQLKLENNSSVEQQSSKSILELSKQDLLETLRLIDNDILSNLCHLIYEAPHLYTYGTGYGQKTILEDFKRGMISGRRAVTSLPTSVELRLNSSIMQKKDVLFIVSMSGQVDNIIKELTFLKDRGVIVVSVTQFTTNPLASIASLNLYIKTNPVQNSLLPNNSYFSYTPLCLLLDLLVKNYLSYHATLQHSL